MALFIISDFLYNPERGDIVVFDGHSVDKTNEPALIKRVIAIAGDTVELKEDGTVIVNGNVLDESDYVDAKHKHKYSGYKAAKWTLRDGEIFVLGDHRNVSNDSEEFGPVSVDCVLGKVLIRIFPFEDFGYPG